MGNFKRVVAGLFVAAAASGALAIAGAATASAASATEYGVIASDVAPDTAAPSIVAGAYK